MICFTDYNIFISVKAYILHHKKEECLSFLKKWLKGKEFKTTLYPLPNVCTLQKNKNII